MDNMFLKDLQKVELEILLEVDRICKKNNIRYFLVSGTLLGAIRHKGFIPWDDDIDICMPIKDYNKFCSVAPKELNSKYFLQNYQSDMISMWFSKVRKNGTAAVEAGREKKTHHQGIWIDIFPLIGIKNDRKWIDNLKKRVDFAKKLLKIKIDCIEENEKLPFYKKIHNLIPLSLIRMISGRIYKTAFKSHEDFDCCYYIWAENNIRARFKSELFDETINVEFEGHMLPAPKKWDEYLKIVYGDYMTPPPPEKRNGGCHSISYVNLNSEFDNEN